MTGQARRLPKERCISKGRTASSVTIPVTGKTKHAPRLTGSFVVRQFVAKGEPAIPIGAFGTLVLRTRDGRMAVTETTLPVRLGATSARAPFSVDALAVTSEILALTLGPIDLSLFALEVRLDAVHLLIEASPAGGVLADLLLAIATLRSSGDLRTVQDGVIDVLNQLLGAL
jgi:hypothetical protein